MGNLHVRLSFEGLYQIKSHFENIPNNRSFWTHLQGQDSEPCKPIVCEFDKLVIKRLNILLFLLWFEYFDNSSNLIYSIYPMKSYIDLLFTSSSLLTLPYHQFPITLSSRGLH